MPKIYTHSPNSLRPKRQSAEDALETPEDEVYSYPENTNVPTRIKVEEISDSDNFIYSFGNDGRPSRVKGRDSAFVPPAPVITEQMMVLKIDTTKSAGTDFILPLFGTVDVEVDWGDGTVETFTTAGERTHTYAEEGEYQVILDGTVTEWGRNTWADSSLTTSRVNSQQKMTEVYQWGTLGLIATVGMFRETKGYFVIANDFPSTVASMANMFRGTGTTFNGDISQWNTSSVTNMGNMFSSSTFNQDISDWDVSSVTNMRGMFSDSTFSGDISQWDVSSVTDMREMFLGSSFNGDISQWDVSGVTNMGIMFSGSPFDGSLEGWVLNPSVSFTALGSSPFFGSAFDGVDPAAPVSPVNYARTLIGWANNIFDRGGVVTNKVIDNNGVSYSTQTFGDMTGEFNNATDARNYLVNTLGWTITDAGSA